jgi:hypothetical protein
LEAPQLPPLLQELLAEFPIKLMLSFSLVFVWQSPSSVGLRAALAGTS